MKGTPREDLTGRKYNRLTVIEFVKMEKKKSYWKCQCECGNELVTRGDALKNGNTKSCGCLQKEKAIDSAKCAREQKKPLIDISGNTYGRLTVIELDHKQQNDHGSIIFWKCQCECGETTVVRGTYLKNGKTKSCGCLQKEKSGLNLKTHGDSKTRFYKIFLGIKSRCNDKNNSHYNYYGGRGIKVEWNSYEEFKKDMYDEYIKMISVYEEKSISIDRIDVNKNYCKSNCRWVTDKIQRNNKTNTIYVEMNDGILIPLKIFSEKYNIPYGTLNSRYQRSEYNGTHIIPYNKIIID